MIQSLVQFSVGTSEVNKYYSDYCRVKKGTKHEKLVRESMSDANRVQKNQKIRAQADPEQSNSPTGLSYQILTNSSGRCLLRIHSSPQTICLERKPGELSPVARAVEGRRCVCAAARTAGYTSGWTEFVNTGRLAGPIPVGECFGDLA
jgi:hypothetical protein